MDKKSRLLYRLRMNQETGEWEMYTDESLLTDELYIQAANRMEEIREQLIEDALAQSEWTESEEIIGWVKRLDTN